MMVQTNRNLSVEVYRCFCMFGICLLHAFGFSSTPYKTVTNIFLPCVDAFAFISGWFGCSFGFKKVIRLWSIGLYCAALMSVTLVQTDTCNMAYGDWIHQFFRMFKNYWFLHAYIVLLLVSPLINHVFERNYDNAANQYVLKSICPFLLLAFGWSFISTFKFCKLWVPIPAGLGSYTPLTLIGVYIVGRYCRWSGCLERISSIRMFVLLIISVVVSASGLGRYSSPLAALIAALSFSLFYRLKFPGPIGKVAALMGPSMFSIYLLQTNDFGIELIKTITTRHAHSFLVPIIVAFGLFFMG